MCKFRTLVMIGVAAALLAAGGSRGDEISLLGYWEVGPCHGLDVNGSLACHGNGSHLEVVDVGQAAAPRPLGRVQLPSAVDDVAVVGALAFVADSYGGLQIVDLADAAAPVLVGGLDIGTRAAAIAVDAGFAYIVDTYEGLYIVDVADPTRPRVVQHLAPGAFPQDIWVGGQLALLATWDGMFIYDVGDPLHPALLAQIPEGAYYGYEGVTARDGLMFVAAAQGGLSIWDISNPRQPRFLDDQNVGDEALDVSLAGTRAVVSCGHTGLRVIDVTEPDAIAIVAQLDPPGSSGEVLCRGDLAYLASGAAGVQVIDLADPAQPTVVGELPVGGMGVGVQVRDDIAYVAEDNGGVRTLDLSTAARPTPLGYCRIDGRLAGIAVEGDFAYVTGSSGLHIVDIADAADPREVGVYLSHGGYRDVAVRGHLVCCVDLTVGLVVLDVTDPTAPACHGRLALPGAESVVMDDRYTYYAVVDLQGDSGGLYVVDHTVAGTPAIVGRLQTRKASLTAVEGDHLYYWGRGDAPEPGLVVVDVADPANPRQIGFLSVPWPPTAIAASCGQVYLFKMFEQTLVAVDVTDAAAPQVVAQYERPGWFAFCLEADAGRIYANGVWVLQHEHLTGGPSPAARGCRLESVSPNPGNPLVTVAFDVARPQRVDVGVYGVDGRRLATLGDGPWSAGRHTLAWMGTDAHGRALPSGVYLVRLAAEDGVTSRKVTLVR